MTWSQGFMIVGEMCHELFPWPVMVFLPINRNGLNSPRKNDDLELLEVLPSNDFLRLWGIVV